MVFGTLDKALPWHITYKFMKWHPFSVKQFLLYSGADDFSATLDPQKLLLLFVFILKVHVFIK